MKRNNQEVPAIVLGSGITALGVIRSLASVGIAAYLLPSQRDYVRWSRWAKPLSLYLDDFPSAKGLAQTLESLPLQKAVLFPCNDAVLLAAAGQSSGLGERFPTSLSSLDTLQILSDKGKFAMLLEENHIPHPETILVEHAEQLAVMDDQDFKDRFLKPCNSKGFGSRFGVKAFAVSGREDAIQKFSQAQEAGLDMMLQEYIPGPASEHYFVDGFVDRHGHICAHFPRQRLRIYPPSFGNSSYCESVPLRRVSPAIEDLDRLLALLHYRGIFSAEFKFDRREDQFKILEINARPWWFIEFATRCGVNTCQMAYQDALGQDSNTIAEYREGIGCINTLHDLKAAFGLFQTNELSPASWFRQWLRGQQAIFYWRDPLPAIFNFLEKARANAQGASRMQSTATTTKTQPNGYSEKAIH
jgi:D-aspartate ligase